MIVKITERVDEVSQYYILIEKLEVISKSLFWIIATLSLATPYSISILGKMTAGILQTVFLLLVLTYFFISQASSLYLLPRVELMRRKQMLSNSLGVSLTHERTSLYYNNSFSPSVQRLGANTMENAFFSKEISLKMLSKKRIITFGYFIAWFAAFSLRHDNLELLAWITQLVFSSEIFSQWLKLENLRFHHEQVYGDLHSLFLNRIGTETETVSITATVLNAFATYESSKSAAGILLSKRIFQKLNPSLSEQWKQICEELDMHHEID
jgi:hypothetical protein